MQWLIQLLSDGDCCNLFVMAASSVANQVSQWRYTDIVSALRQHGPEFLTDQFLGAVIALVERERFDGDDLLEASADDGVLSASWLPPDTNASQTRVCHGIMRVKKLSTHG